MSIEVNALLLQFKEGSAESPETSSVVSLLLRQLNDVNVVPFGKYSSERLLDSQLSDFSAAFCDTFSMVKLLLAPQFNDVRLVFRNAD